MIDCNSRKQWNTNECKKRVGEAEFKLIIPKRDNSGKPIKEQILKKYIHKVNKIFGGSTTYPSVYGCYKESDSGKYFCESNFLISAARDFDSIYDKSLRKLNASGRIRKIEQDYKFLKSLARKASKELGQDSIFVESDFINDASYVKRKGSKKSGLPESKISDRVIGFE